jgi:hypothetical protein
MKKLFIITIAIMSLCILLVACGNNTTETPSDTSNTENTENIENQETETPTCTNHIDADGDKKCDNCSFTFIEVDENVVDERLVNAAVAFNKFLKGNYGIDYTELNKKFTFIDVQSDDPELNIESLLPVETIVFHDNVAHVKFNSSGLVRNMYCALDTERIFIAAENSGIYSYETLEYTNVFYDHFYLTLKHIEPKHLEYDESLDEYSVKTEYFEELAETNSMLAFYDYNISFSIDDKQNIISLIVNELADETLSTMLTFTRNDRNYSIIEYNYNDEGQSSLQAMSYTEIDSENSLITTSYEYFDGESEKFSITIKVEDSNVFENEIYEQLNMSKFIYDNYENVKNKYSENIPTQEDCECSTIAVFDEEYNCYVKFYIDSDGYEFFDIIDYDSTNMCLGSIVDGYMVVTEHAVLENKTKLAEEKYADAIFTCDGGCPLIFVFDDDLQSYVIFYHIDDSANQYEFEYLVPDLLADLLIGTGKYCEGTIDGSSLIVQRHVEHE